MHLAPYKYNRTGIFRYTFISEGKKNIEKVIDFTPTARKYIYNLGFGDLLPNGEIDDTAKSNNGDITKVFATVIDILQDFTEQYPSIKIMFFGGTSQRTALYHRILKTYFQSFSKQFIITGFVDSEDIVEVPFDPKSNQSYNVFFVKRIK